MPLQSCHFHAEVNSATKEIAVRVHGSEEDLAALMVCAICKSKQFRDVFKLTQRLLIEEGINLQVSRYEDKCKSAGGDACAPGHN